MARLTLFLIIALSIVGGIHFYLWARLVRDTQLPSSVRVWATAALIALAVSMPASLFALRRLSDPWARAVAWPIFIWMGLMFLAFVLVVAGDLVRGAVLLGARLGTGQPLDPDRRLLLARLLGGGAGMTAGVLGAIAVHQATADLVVRDLTIPLPRLPAAAEGTTIVQVTDLHVGPTIGRAFIEDVVRRVNALDPDIVAITGDLVDGSVARLREAVAPLAELRARHGVFFVTGNHEYYSGVDEWVRHLGSLGIRVLSNERIAIGGFDLAGVDDPSARQHGGGPDLRRALDGRDPTRPVVLLAHQPRAVLEAAELGVDLQLSGHTHGGQIPALTFFVKLQQPYVAGLHRHRGTIIYVSPGTGYWGPPMRLGTRAEITRVVLTRPPSAEA